MLRTVVGHPLAVKEVGPCKLRRTAQDKTGSERLDRRCTQQSLVFALSVTWNEEDHMPVTASFLSCPRSSTLASLSVTHLFPPFSIHRTSSSTASLGCLQLSLGVAHVSPNTHTANHVHPSWPRMPVAGQTKVSSEPQTSTGCSLLSQPCPLQGCP